MRNNESIVTIIDKNIEKKSERTRFYDTDHRGCRKDHVQRKNVALMDSWPSKSLNQYKNWKQ